MKKKKIIVTHIFPDLDAITSVWLLRRFDSRLGEAEVKFVPAGTTWEKQAVDSDPDIIHVDTGGGRFDHHQTGEKICAAGLVFEYLKSSSEMTDIFRYSISVYILYQEITTNTTSFGTNLLFIF